MNENKQPGIKFHNVILKDISFRREPEILEKPKLNFEFNNNIEYNEDKTFCNAELNCKMSDDDKKFTIDITVLGIFSVDKNNENMTLENFIQNNSMAMLFPYIREAISDIARRAGIGQILLPPINIKAILDRQKSDKLKK